MFGKFSFLHSNNPPNIHMESFRMYINTFISTHNNICFPPASCRCTYFSHNYLGMKTRASATFHELHGRYSTVSSSMAETGESFWTRVLIEGVIIPQYTTSFLYITVTGDTILSSVVSGWLVCLETIDCHFRGKRIFIEYSFHGPGNWNTFRIDNNLWTLLWTFSMPSPKFSTGVNSISWNKVNT